MRAGRFGRNVGAKDIIDIERPRPGRRKRLVVMKSEKDINKDPFEEYLRESEPTHRESVYYWQTAIGLQAVDGLVTSDYLKETAKTSIEGGISIEKAQELVESYYRENSKSSDDRTEEADIVSVRIAAILAEKAFSFSSTQYLSIHKRLFNEIYPHAGKIRDYNITKNEWVLDGDTVLYGGAAELREALEYDLAQEKAFNYAGLTMQEVIRHLARFISRLWQIHIFGEGNTRTTAVFFIKYLRSIGFDVTNDIFAKNAWYFRNAMVRANYTNLQKGVHETTEYLEVFLRNLLLGEKTPLHNRDMHISGILHSETTTFGQIKDSVNGPINDPINDPIKLNERENQLLLLLRESPELTRKKLAERLGCSESTVKRELKLLSDKGILRRIGSKKTGVWVIHS